MIRIVLFFLIFGIVFGTVAAEPMDEQVTPARTGRPVIAKSAPARLQPLDYRPNYAGLDFTQSSNDAHFTLDMIAGGDNVVADLGFDDPLCAGYYAASPDLEVFVDSSISRVDFWFTHNAATLSGDSNAGLMVLDNYGRLIGCQQQPNGADGVDMYVTMNGDLTLEVWVTSFYNETFQGVLNISSTLAN